MGDWFIKTFRKHHAVKAYIAYPDGRLKLHWVIPDGDTIQIKEMKFQLRKENRLLSSKGIPTYAFNTNSTEPINMLGEKVTPLSPEEYLVATESHVAREIIESAQKKIDFGMINFVFSLIILVAVGAGIYLVKDSLDLIIQKLDLLLSELGLI